MSLLYRYLIRQNVFLLSVILLVGTALYLLTDMFERLDHFLDSNVGLGVVLVFFVYKIPMIIALILPAVYLLALVAQLNMLDRGRELIALTAGGISPATFVRFIVIYSLLWSCAQFFFAQVIGVAMEQAASRIWQEDVRGNMLEEASLKGLWFTEKNRIVYIGVAYPLQKKGSDILVYSLDESGIGITEIVKAKSYVIDAHNNWTLSNGSRIVPATYASTHFESISLSLSQDLRAFQVGSKTSAIRPSDLSLQELADTINRLEEAGSNVERLRTAWHGKLAYACSLLIMGLLALIVSRTTSNIYLAVLLSLVITFFYYAVNTVCIALGEKGFLVPSLAAWLANVAFGFFSLMWIFKKELQGLWRRNRAPFAV